MMKKKRIMKKKKNAGLAANLIYGEITNNENSFGIDHSTPYYECSGIPSICRSCLGCPHGYIRKNSRRTNGLKRKEDTQ